MTIQMNVIYFILNNTKFKNFLRLLRTFQELPVTQFSFLQQDHDQKYALILLHKQRIFISYLRVNLK